MIIVNILLGIDDLDPKLSIRTYLVPTLWHLQQIEIANYEYNTRQCLELLRDY